MCQCCIKLNIMLVYQNSDSSHFYKFRKDSSICNDIVNHLFEIFYSIISCLFVNIAPVSNYRKSWEILLMSEKCVAIFGCKKRSPYINPLLV